MSSKTRWLVGMTMLLASSAVACAGTEARPVVGGVTPVQCVGATLRSADEAARYAGCEAVSGDLRVVGSELSMALRNGVQIIGALIMLFVIDVQLTLLMLSIVPPLVLTTIYFGRKIRAMARSVSRYASHSRRARPYARPSGRGKSR